MKKLWKLIPLAVLILLILLALSKGVATVQTAQQAEDLQILEEALRRTAVACYAAEGIYPPDLAYLQEHYGIQVNEDRYYVFYEVFGANMMPDITVLEREA